MAKKVRNPPVLRCPHCGEIIDIAIDEGGLNRQNYVEDCSVCCRPLMVHIEIDREDGFHRVAVDAEI